MKNVLIISVVVLVALFLMTNKPGENDKHIDEKYPWQIKVLKNGETSVFGILLGKTLLKDAEYILKSTPKMALFDNKGDLSLEAYYKNVSLGGLIGSFIFTLEANVELLNKIKNSSSKKERAEDNGTRYELDKPTSDNAKSLIIKNLIYIPTVQLNEDTIIRRFGEPTYKIKLKTKEIGWHYLYPEKGLDLIFKEEGKEVLQYVQPKHFKLLLEPLQTR